MQAHPKKEQYISNIFPDMGIEMWKKEKINCIE